MPKCLGCGKPLVNTYRGDQGKLCHKCRKVKGH